MRFSYCVGTTLVTAALFLFYFTHYRPFLKLFFGCYTLTALLLFLGTSIVCVNNLMRTADLVLQFSHRTSFCIHTLEIDLKVFTVLLNLTKKKCKQMFQLLRVNRFGQNWTRLTPNRQIMNL